jgi:ribosomal protein S10
MVKIITKRVHKNLDNFLGNIQENNQNEGLKPQTPAPVPEVQEKRKTIKKGSDGLIEKVSLESKIYITEDNRQLLND